MLLTESTDILGAIFSNHAFCHGVLDYFNQLHMYNEY